MARGGSRPNAGSPKGAPNKRTAELQRQIEASGDTPLDFLLNVMRNPEADFEARFEAAKAAAPYVHPKLSAIDANVSLRPTHEDVLDELDRLERWPTVIRLPERPSGSSPAFASRLLSFRMRDVGGITEHGRDCKPCCAEQASHCDCDPQPRAIRHFGLRVVKVVTAPRGLSSGQSAYPWTRARRCPRSVRCPRLRSLGPVSLN